MSGQHARLSASAAHRWLVCAGSVNAQQGLDDTNVHAATGTFAHHIAAQCLMDEKRSPSEWLGIKTIIDGHQVECDQEMVDVVGEYIAVIRSDVYNFQPGAQLAVEMPLIRALQSVDRDFGGTADAVRYSTTTRHLRVFDFKYGSGTYVDADANEQLMLYALGAMLEVNKPVTEVMVTIVQPRFEGAEPVRNYSFKASDILDFMHRLKEAAALTRLPSPPLVAGEHCKFCKAAKSCPELERKHHDLVNVEFQAVYDPAKLAAALASVPLVKERIKAIEEFAYAEAIKGVPIPGFKLVDKVARRSWKSEGDVVEWAQANKIDPYAPKELLSPAQMEKKTKVPAEFVEKKSSGTVLVPESDKRQPAKTVTADDFDLLPGVK